jgi:hypothetical protein
MWYMNEHEKIVTIHIDEYLDLKQQIEKLSISKEWLINRNNFLLNEIEILKQTQKKWYHLF